MHGCRTGSLLIHRTGCGRIDMRTKFNYFGCTVNGRCPLNRKTPLTARGLSAPPASSSSCCKAPAPQSWRSAGFVSSSVWARCCGRRAQSACHRISRRRHPHSNDGHRRDRFLHQPVCDLANPQPAFAALLAVAHSPATPKQKRAEALQIVLAIDNPCARDVRVDNPPHRSQRR